MSDFEIFGGFEAQNQMDPAAFERFKEQMRSNAAQIKAMQAGEQKQKQKEDKLIKILLKFLRSSRKSDLVLLIARVLEENVPAGLILSIILLGNEDIQEESGIKLELAPGIRQMNAGNSEIHSSHDSYFSGISNKQAERSTTEMEANTSSASRQIVEFSDMQKVLPLKIRISIDLWGKNILETARAHPHKVLKTVLDREGTLKPVVTRLTVHVLLEYLESQSIRSEIATLKEFSEFILNGVIREIKFQIEGQKELREG